MSEALSEVVRLEGYLNQLGGVALRDQIRAKLESHPAELSLDFSATRLVNSIGVSFLLEIIEAAAQAGTRLEFIGVSSDIHDLFELLGISRKVPVKLQ